MALTLLEAAKLATDPLQKGVISIFASSSPILERLPFFDVAGMAYRYNQEQTLPGHRLPRDQCQSYTESTGIVNPAVESLIMSWAV